MSSAAYTLVLGLGVTGASCVRYLATRARTDGAASQRDARDDDAPATIVAMDSRPNPPLAAAIQRNFPNVRCLLGAFDAATIDGAQRIIASPGIANLPALTRTARARGVAVLSDIDLFAKQARAPVVGITGTNGKSTVTTLVGELLAAAGQRVAIGGNLGTPALDLLADDVDTYVLELSSFQLDITNSLQCAAATVLNVTPDHLDRYVDLEAYAAVKRRIYKGAGVAVVNRADASTTPATTSTAQLVSFGLDAPLAGHFGVRSINQRRALCEGESQIVDSAALKVRGTHNEENVLAALALVRAMGVPVQRVVPALRAFGGLPHRCQPVATVSGVEFINDSKATNEGAALAALAGVGASISGRIVLIAGGDGKGSDFHDLVAALPGPVRLLVTIGRDGPRLSAAVGDRVAQQQAGDLAAAVRIAFAAASPGDCVLLAPACASLDQFRNFEHRGQVFIEQVHALAASVAGEARA